MVDTKLPRSQRLARRDARRLYAGLAACLALAVAIVAMLAPSVTERPQVIIYSASDCAECGRWINYLNRHGFRATHGPAEKWESVRRVHRLPPGFQGRAVATVDGLWVSGFVPAAEIHKLVRRELGDRVLGVAVQSGALPPWSTGAIASRGLTVFAVLPGGMLRPVKVYHGFGADGPPRA